jgi:hypothetical protein
MAGAAFADESRSPRGVSSSMAEKGSWLAAGRFGRKGMREARRFAAAMTGARGDFAGEDPFLGATAF